MTGTSQIVVGINRQSLGSPTSDLSKPRIVYIPSSGDYGSKCVLDADIPGSLVDIFTEVQNNVPIGLN